MISLIAAIQEGDRGIGIGSELLFRIGDDMARFIGLTRGKTVLMGRKTFDTLKEPNKPLRNRTNVVLTRDRDWSFPGVEVRHSLAEALDEFGSGDTELVVMGGGQIYAEAISRADRLYLTIVSPDVPRHADSFFPEYEKDFPVVSDRQNFVDTETGLAYSFETRTRA